MSPARDPWDDTTPSTIIALQCGSLAVIAPWLSISQPLSCRGSFRFEIVHGQLALGSGQVDGQHVLRGIPDERCVIETRATEHVSGFNTRSPSEMHEAGATLCLGVDTSKEKWDWILLPVDPVRKTLLLRVASGDHSRMVDPSNTLRWLSCVTEVPACGHTLPNEGAVPENAQVQLHGFEELLGRGGERITTQMMNFIPSSPTTTWIWIRMRTRSRQWGL
jgi:hypothetical protein